ncbi:MAG: SAM-dependent methyltransferase [Opitutaceae bacterium]|nr:SAM-dependent methyltransferase [Opitutaceae bacterium]
MGSSAAIPPPLPPEFQAAFRARADPDDTMSFDRFMALALYHPQLGYYRQSRVRVGRAPGTDFFTATSSGPLFGELVAAACVKRLRAAGRDPAAHTWVEIGAEPDGGGVLAGVPHPFRGAQTIRLGEPLALTGECIVFSNELFDAQPCLRHVVRRGRWWELGVALRDGALVEVELDSDVIRAPTVRAPEGYHFDQPLAAAALADEIASQPWRGLFVAIDYGKTLHELTQATPGGTARAYYRHTQSNDLLARPGEQDLTCHVCWDWIADALKRHGFAAPALDFQESFLIHHAGELIAAISAAEAAQTSPRKRALMQLLHAGHLGQKFQVLHALR